MIASSQNESQGENSATMEVDKAATYKEPPNMNSFLDHDDLLCEPRNRHLEDAKAKALLAVHTSYTHFNQTGVLNPY